MGYFDWIFKYKFENEKAALIDLRTYTIDWFNDVTKPLMPILEEIEFKQPSTKSAKHYFEIAREIYNVKVSANAGTHLHNVLESMSERGIPLFTSRKRLLEAATDFQQKGLFVKDLAANLHRWKHMNAEERKLSTRHLFQGWKAFEASKDELLSELNTQIKMLG